MGHRLSLWALIAVCGALCRYGVAEDVPSPDTGLPSLRVGLAGLRFRLDATQTVAEAPLSATRGERLAIAVSGPGRELRAQLTVYGENEPIPLRRVTASMRGEPLVCYFTAPQTGRYRVQVQNAESPSVAVPQTFTLSVSTRAWLLNAGAAGLSCSEIYLSWMASGAEGIVEYKIYWAPDLNSGFSLLDNLPASVFSYVHEYLDEDEDYYYQIEECDSNQCLPLSSPFMGNTLSMAHDVDEDGVPTCLEYLEPQSTRWNRLLPDSDGDGAGDGTEDANQNGLRDLGELNPRNQDTDGEGLEDGMELTVTQTEPYNSYDPPDYDPEDDDTDSDGLPNSEDPDPDDPDTDGDRIDDGYEAQTLGVSAASDSEQYPPIGDAYPDGSITNLDALAVQAIWNLISARNPQVYANQGAANADPSRDGYITNLDALLISVYSLNLIPRLPLR